MAFDDDVPTPGKRWLRCDECGAQTQETRDVMERGWRQYAVNESLAIWLCPKCAGVEK